MTGPARKLGKSAVQNIVRFPAIKSNGGKTILVESILESEYCLHLEFDPDVVAYFPQPKTFIMDDGLGETSYTPDFEVHYASGRKELVEVKPLSRSESDRFRQKFARFESLLKPTNYQFKVVNEIDIEKQPLLSNYQKLYRFKKRPTLDMDNLHRCAAQIKSQISLLELRAMLGGYASLREIYSWLALGFLHFDIRSESLVMATQVKFHVD